MLYEIDILKNFANLTKKNTAWESPFNKVAGRKPADSDTGVFLLILLNFLEQLFYRTLSVAISEINHLTVVVKQ